MRKTPPLMKTYSQRDLRGSSYVLGSEDVLPSANDGAGGGGTRNLYYNPGVGAGAFSPLVGPASLGPNHTQQADSVQLTLAGRIPRGQVCSEMQLSLCR